MRVSRDPTVLTYMEWVMMGYRIAADAVPVEFDDDGEPMYSGEDVFLDDEDL